MPTAVSTVARQNPVRLLSGNPATTNVGADTSMGWIAANVNHILIQNNTNANLNWELDQPANAGSPLLIPGATIFLDVAAATVHLFTAAAQTLNGAAAGGIVVRGWM